MKDTIRKWLEEKNEPPGMVNPILSLLKKRGITSEEKVEEILRRFENAKDLIDFLTNQQKQQPQTQKRLGSITKGIGIKIPEIPKEILITIAAVAIIILVLTIGVRKILSSRITPIMQAETKVSPIPEMETLPAPSLEFEEEPAPQPTALPAPASPFDAGSIPKKEPAQWLQLVLLLATGLQFFADAGQRWRKSRGDWQKVTSFVAPAMAIFAIALIVWGDKDWAIPLLGGDPLARILLIILTGFLLTRGDPSFLASIIIFLVLVYSNLTDKSTGIFLDLLGVKNSVIWKSPSLVEMISQNQWGEAKLTILVIVLVATAAALFLADLTMSKQRFSPSVVLGIAGGILLAVVVNLIGGAVVPFGFVLIIAIAATIYYDRDKWDEGLGLLIGVCFLTNYFIGS